MNAWAIGYNAYGQLGLGKADNFVYSCRSWKIEPSSRNQQAAAGSYHSLFLDANEKVWSCGRNTHGELAVKHLALAKPEQTRILPRFAPHTSNLCRIQLFPVCWCWWRVWKCGVTELQDGLEGIQCAQYVAHNVYLDAEGQVWVAGGNSEGQLGLGASFVTLGDIQVHV